MRVDKLVYAKGALFIQAEQFSWMDSAIKVAQQVLDDHKMLAQLQTSTAGTLSRPVTNELGIDMGYYKESALQGQPHTDKPTVDLVLISVDPSAMPSKEQLRAIIDSFVALAEDNGYHTTGTIMRGGESGDDQHDLGFSLRFFKTDEWPCTEHPELLYGAPIGMYHCQVCGEMQMAGSFHLEPMSDIAETQV